MSRMCACACGCACALEWRGKRGPAGISESRGGSHRGRGSVLGVGCWQQLGSCCRNSAEVDCLGAVTAPWPPSAHLLPPTLTPPLHRRRALCSLMRSTPSAAIASTGRTTRARRSTSCWWRWMVLRPMRWVWVCRVCVCVYAFMCVCVCERGRGESGGKGWVGEGAGEKGFTGGSSAALRPPGAVHALALPLIESLSRISPCLLLC